MIMQNSTPTPQTPQPVTTKPNEQGRVLIQDHFRIMDPKNNEILVKGRG
jgi:hypothetical protein